MRNVAVQVDGVLELCRTTLGFRRDAWRVRSNACEAHGLPLHGGYVRVDGTGIPMKMSSLGVQGLGQSQLPGAKSAVGVVQMHVNHVLRASAGS